MQTEACAAITAEEQSLGTNVSDNTVNVILDVYVSCTTVDGVRYGLKLRDILLRDETIPDGANNYVGWSNPAYPRGFFIYMLLDNGEFVTEICRRYTLAAGNRVSACLVFITNKGGSTLFGTSGPPEPCSVLNRILTPAQYGTQIWFNDTKSVHQKSLRYIAMDGLAPPVQRPFLPSLVSNLPYFWTQNTEPWFVSSCNMGGIMGMTI
ncbi:unnamed protein product [Fusarium venenatum]|uniref:Uncharacterized protein n=1 Tax=Fusarium venenatum TaxID=56646 RepID=A0A2L2SXE6_9HYPO|nr:uncharacterized protein FVRRES_05954 [Fusarium venenatum]CEI61518.1 unnamed protein product [Fusarium venenatum]